MSYTSEQIRETIKQFIIETEQNDLPAVISFCIGYYGSVTPQIWFAITKMRMQQLITR